MRLTHTFVLAAFLLLPRGAHAQSPASAVPTLTRIFVTFSAGGPPLEGSLLSLSADSVALLVAGHAQTMPLDSVKRIDREDDPTSDGVQKGALVLGLWCAVICGQGVSSGNELPAVILGNMVIGGLIGWHVDRVHVGRSRIYPVTPDWRDVAFPK